MCKSGTEAVCPEICCLKAREVQGRKECVLSKCLKGASKMPVYSWLCNPICPSPLPEAAPEVRSSWALEIAVYYVLFKMVFFSKWEQTRNSYLQCKIPCKDKVLVAIYCKASVRWALPPLATPHFPQPELKEIPFQYSLQHQKACI